MTHQRLSSIPLDPHLRRKRFQATHAFFDGDFDGDGYSSGGDDPHPPATTHQRLSSIPLDPHLQRKRFRVTHAFFDGDGYSSGGDDDSSGGDGEIVTEIGNIMSLGARESCEFFHDPFKGKSDEGKVRKVLKVEPLPDGSGRFFNLSVQNKLLNMDENIYIPVSKAEFAVLVSSFNVKGKEKMVSSQGEESLELYSRARAQEKEIQYLKEQIGSCQYKSKMCF